MTASEGGEPLLVAGVPRSGTSWIARLVCEGIADPRYVYEPDNEKISPAALWLKRHRPRFPRASPGEEAPDLHRLFRLALTGGLPAGRLSKALRKGLLAAAGPVESHVRRKSCPTGGDGGRRPLAPRERAVVGSWQAAGAALSRAGHLRSSRPACADVLKTVHMVFSVEWLARAFGSRVLLVARNPYAVAASMIGNEMPDGDRCLTVEPGRAPPEWLREWREEYRDRLAPERVAPIANVLLMTAAVARQAGRNPGWAVVSHDRLCVESDYADRFRAAFGCSSLDPADAGPELVSYRKWQPVKWIRTLGRSDVAAIRGGLERAGALTWYRNNIYARRAWPEEATALARSAAGRAGRTETE